jgi:hypothetical protein
LRSTNPRAAPPESAKELPLSALERVLRFPILRGIPKFGEQWEFFIMMMEGGDGTSIQPGFA